MKHTMLSQEKTIRLLDYVRSLDFDGKAPPFADVAKAAEKAAP